MIGRTDGLSTSLFDECRQLHRRPPEEGDATAQQLYEAVGYRHERGFRTYELDVP